ncbi:MAG: bifunctional serine/threonine-protein kinase/formylglycine-generating enzyme family protein [Candidatus Competibacterales bacterium]
MAKDPGNTSSPPAVAPVADPSTQPLGSEAVAGDGTLPPGVGEDEVATEVSLGIATEVSPGVATEVSPARDAQGNRGGPAEGVGPPHPSDMATAFPPGIVVLDNYRIEALLARGGMGEVYLARNISIETQHAIKVIRPEYLASLEALELAKREATALRSIRHDAVVGYEGFLQDKQGRFFLIMEYVEGPSLARLLRQRVFTVGQILALRDRLIDGLGAVHRTGIIHRDLSPGNIVLPGGDVAMAKIIDFGIAKVTSASETIIGANFAGKLGYVAPEQLGLFEGQISPRTDLYSLGLVLAAASRGSPLDMGSTFVDAMEKRQTVPDLAGVPRALHGQITALLQPDPTHRPRSAESLRRRWPAGAAARRRWWRRFMGALAAVAVVGIVAVASIMELRRGYESDGPAVYSPTDPSPTDPSPTDDKPVAEWMAEVSRWGGGGAIGTLAAAPPTEMPPLEQQPRRVVLGSTALDITGALALCREHIDRCDAAWYSSEGLRHETLTPYVMDATEVTQGNFAAFVFATGHVTHAERQGFSRYADGIVSLMLEGAHWRQPLGPGSRVDPLSPVTHMSFEDARRYCQWRGGRLPTEDEWEYMARGEARRTFPWGDTWQPSRLQWPGAKGVESLAMVGSHPAGATPSGIHDLAGSVWEWTETLEEGGYVLKGGSWLEYNPANFRAATRRVDGPDQVYADNGFRCVYDWPFWPPLEP